jgi:hypothetical protein
MNNSRVFTYQKDGKDIQVRLEANGLTVTRFYWITKKDLVDTIRENYYAEMQQVDKMGKFAGMKQADFLKLDESERNAMYDAFRNLKVGNTQFYYDFTAALIMSADKNLHDYESVLQMIPPAWLKAGSAEAQAINELMLSYIIDLDEFQKKNMAQAKPNRIKRHTQFSC